ncbi:MAG: hypothetical protein JJU21_17970 [Salinarimonas sp.]|nr:hypothetical protein [Salinarimonas sp.]
MHPKIAARRREVSIQPMRLIDASLDKVLAESDHHLARIESRTEGQQTFNREREFCQHARHLLKTTTPDTKTGVNARANIIVGLTQMRNMLQAIAKSA